MPQPAKEVVEQRRRPAEQHEQPDPGAQEPLHLAKRPRPGRRSYQPPHQQHRARGCREPRHPVHDRQDRGDLRPIHLQMRRKRPADQLPVAPIGHHQRITDIFHRDGKLQNGPDDVSYLATWAGSTRTQLRCSMGRVAFWDRWLHGSSGPPSSVHIGAGLPARECSPRECPPRQQTAASSIRNACPGHMVGRLIKRAGPGRPQQDPA